MNKFYIATRENFAKAILDHSYMLEVLLIRDGEPPTHTRLTAAIMSTRRIDANKYEVTTYGLSHMMYLHLL